MSLCAFIDLLDRDAVTLALLAASAWNRALPPAALAAWIYENFFSTATFASRDDTSLVVECDSLAIDLHLSGLLRSLSGLRPYRLRANGVSCELERAAT